MLCAVKKRNEAINKRTQNYVSGNYVRNVCLKHELVCETVEYAFEF